MRTLNAWLTPGLVLVLSACGGGDDDAADPTPIGGNPDAVAPDSTVESDSGPADMTVEPDAERPPQCFSANIGPLERARTEAVPGLWNVRADVDANADGATDLALFVQTAEANEVVFLNGADRAELSRFRTPAGERIELLPGFVPTLDRFGPVDAGGGPSWIVLGRLAEAATLRVIDATSGAERVAVALAGVPESVHLLPGGQGGLALVNFVGGAYRLVDLGSPDTGPSGNFGRVYPGWDYNGDGKTEVVQQVGAGINVLDALSLEVAGNIALEGALLGFVPVSNAAGAPTPGGSDLRDSGAEVPSARVEQGGIRVAYHDPESLRSRYDAIPFMADVAEVDNVPQLRFVASAQGLRLQTVEQRAAARIFKLYELADRQVRGEIGPFVNLTIREGVDVDGDAYGELELRTGPRPDGINGEVSYVSTANGAELVRLPEERSARFDPVFLRQDGLERLVDLDGCAGAEFLLLRSQAPNAEGARLTRVQLHRQDGTAVFKGEATTRRVHALALGHLDGDTIPEIVEVLDAGEGAAQLVVYGRP